MCKNEKRAQAQKLPDDELAHASGGVGYTSIRCKKCNMTFSDMDQYIKHIEQGHAPGRTEKRNV